MQTNLYRALLDLLPQDPLLVGTVTAVHTDGTATVRYPGGGVQRARGNGVVGSLVFVRAGAIEREAPALTPLTIEV